MNHPSDPTDAKPQVNPQPGGSSALPSRGADRRRLLLKGVGRGSALVGATLPLKTLAGQRVITTDGTQCTLSGMQSGVHSASPANSLVCSGAPLTRYANLLNWPSGVIPTTACNVVFTSCALKGPDNKAASLFYVVTHYSDKEDAHWVCAWLNAQSSSSRNFPYSAADVVKQYNYTDLTKRSSAYAFYVKYTES